MTPPKTIPAATLILLRPGPGDAAEVLMIERGGAMAFAAGAMVFPGGRIDPGDGALADAVTPDGDRLEAAARVAAIRETIEEVGIAVALVPLPDGEAVARLRSGLAAGGDFGALLAGEGLTIDPAALTPFARWRPNLHQTRNFDTFFFLAAAPGDAVATPDGGESVHAVWASAHTLLAEADAGRHRIIFPTRRNLERLARSASLEAACQDAARYPVAPITPWIEERDAALWLCIPDDRGYPITAEPVETALRG